MIAHAIPYSNLLTDASSTQWGRQRDAQRKRVYDSEHSIKSTKAKTFSLRAAQALVDRIADSDYWRLIPNTPQSIRVIHSTRAFRFSRAHLSKDEIHLAYWGFTYKTILHELAHFLVPEPHAHHGTVFCARLLQLYTIILGTRCAARLRLSFDLNRVTYK